MYAVIFLEELVMIAEETTKLTNDENEHFISILQKKVQDIYGDSEDTINHMMNSNSGFADPSDRANHEFERNMELKIRDRERKLIGKIKKALLRLDKEEYNECEECGESIGKKRLEARPVTTLCVSCKEVQEQEERARIGR